MNGEGLPPWPERHRLFRRDIWSLIERFMGALVVFARRRQLIAAEGCRRAADGREFFACSWNGGVLVSGGKKSAFGAWIRLLLCRWISSNWRDSRTFDEQLVFPLRRPQQQPLQENNRQLITEKIARMIKTAITSTPALRT
jgi:hypothetical protein